MVWRENRSPFRLVPSNFGHWSRVQLSAESHISVCQWPGDGMPAAVAEVGGSVLALMDAVGVACEGVLARVEVERMEVLRVTEDAVVSFVHKVRCRVSTVACCALWRRCDCGVCGVQIQELSLRDRTSPTSVFTAKWTAVPRYQRGSVKVKHGDDDVVERMAIMSRLHDRHRCFLRELLPGAQLPAHVSRLRGDALARVHVMFHAVSSLDVARSILHHGFAALASLDPGYFGHGIYFSHNLDVRTWLHCAMTVVRVSLSAVCVPGCTDVPVVAVRCDARGDGKAVVSVCVCGCACAVRDAGVRSQRPRRLRVRRDGVRVLRQRVPCERVGASDESTVLAAGQAAGTRPRRTRGVREAVWCCGECGLLPRAAGGVGHPRSTPRAVQRGRAAGLIAGAAHRNPARPHPTKLR